MIICICNSSLIIIILVIILNSDEYKKIVKKCSPKENRLKNILVAFFVGGLIGLIGEVIVYLLMNTFSLTNEDAGMWLCLIMISVASLFTGLGFFDNLVVKCRSGLIIPTTGFASSVTSSAMDYKEDGLITGLGSNFFKLAGSVILYGIISSFILVIVRVIISG